jgi:hypothetical protein
VNVSKYVVGQKCLTYSNAESLLRLKVVLRVALFRSAREPRSAFCLTQCDGSLSRGQKEGGTCNVNYADCVSSSPPRLVASPAKLASVQCPTIRRERYRQQYPDYWQTWSSGRRARLFRQMSGRTLRALSPRLVAARHTMIPTVSASQTTCSEHWLTVDSNW